MTGLGKIKEVIMNHQDKYKLIGIREEVDAFVCFAPIVEETDTRRLEAGVRDLFLGIPETSGIISTHSGVVMMTCSEHIGGMTIPPRNIYVQCFLNEEAARQAYNLSLR